MTSYPFWVTAGVLPNRTEGYSYSSNPEILAYGETTNLPCTVSIPPINGSLPPGTRLEFIGGQIQIRGQISGVVGSQTFDFTLRLSNGTFSTDRTFYITATNATDVLEWQTSNTSLLGYYYSLEPQKFVVTAENTPLKSITYSFPPVISWTQGVSLESDTGLVTVDLVWKPTQIYTLLDYVFNNGYLYKCVVSGQSGIANGPYTVGSNIVDSIDPPWQPNTYYVVNQVVSNDNGKLYVCLVSGFSAPAIGPLGLGGYIPDGFPTAWQYIGQAAVWDQVLPGTIDPLNFSVVASTSTNTVSKTFSVGLISTPHPPIWITEAGSLTSVTPGTNVTVQLTVFEPDAQSVSFTSPDLPSWLNLSLLGEIWGKAPNILSTTVYSFTIVASDGTNTVPRVFSIEVAKDPQAVIWQTPSDLGIIVDGAFSSIQFQAITNRPGTSITYGLRGGNIPPYTIVVSETGMLSGFVEFHAVEKTYFFEVGASDGVDIVVRRFKLTVKNQNLEHYMDIQIPITGVNKLDFIINNSTSLIPPEYLYREQDKNWSRNDNPAISIISGLNYQNVTTVRDVISNYLTEFEVTYGDVYVSEGPNLPYQTLFVSIRDSNSVRPWTPFTFYHSNERVSTSTGLQLVATVSGTSGDFPEPNSSGTDGSVVWRISSLPNTLTNRLLPLPWYPQHKYLTKQTVYNNDQLLTAQTTGYSAGGLGPKAPSLLVPDNQVVWLKQNKQGPNQAFPPSIFNIRQATAGEFGFSNAKGSGAQTTVFVNLSSGALTNVVVNSSGTGYYSQPKITVLGQGERAEVEALLGIQTGTITGSTPGFTVGQEFAVLVGEAVTGQFGRIKISSTNNIGVVTGIEIVNKGVFRHFPKGSIQFSNALKNFSVLFDLGVVSVSIVEPGQGYQAGAFLSFVGTELLPPWQETWADSYVLSIPLADIIDEGARWFKTNPFKVNPYNGHIIEVKQVELSVQGIIWTGNTTFDSECMTWDVDQTRMIEYEPASETVFDNNTTYFDEFTTEFDFVLNNNVPFSQIVFDEDKTIFDYYSTIFDQRASIVSSKFSRTWILNFGKPWQ